jgi:hypothetical protein
MMVLLTKPKLLIQATDKEVVLDALRTRIIYLKTLLRKAQEELRWDGLLQEKTSAAKRKLKQHIRALRVELSYVRATRRRIKSI